MQDNFDVLKAREQKYTDYSSLKTLKKNTVKYILTHKIFKNVIKFRPILRFILKQKGLTKTQVFNYVDK